MQLPTLLRALTGRLRARPASVAAAAVVVVGVVALVIVLTLRGDGAQPTAAGATGEAVSDVTLGADDAGPAFVYRNTLIGDQFGRLAVSPVADPTDRTVTDLDCERVDFRDGIGVCLQADRGVDTSYRALVVDGQLATLHTIELPGEPSRVRISPGGELAGITVFVDGHAYLESGMSTVTTIIDLATGTTIADLEADFTVMRDGESWRQVDFNFWGVTFADADTFYATLATGDDTYLVEGDVPARTMTVGRRDAECPSLSPDGSHLAFKQRVDDGDGPRYQLVVMNLATGDVTTVAEQRSVDDQAAWLDDETLMYGVPDARSVAQLNTWSVPADGTGEPELLLEGSWSTRILP